MPRYSASLLMLALVAVAACGSSNNTGIGAKCTSTTSCTAGLQCVTSYGQSDGGCVALGLECQQTCYSDADCGIIGNGSYTCFSSCGGAGSGYCTPG